METDRFLPLGQGSLGTAHGERARALGSATPGPGSSQASPRRGRDSAPGGRDQPVTPEAEERGRDEADGHPHPAPAQARAPWARQRIERTPPPSRCSGSDSARKRQQAGNTLRGWWHWLSAPHRDTEQRDHQHAGHTEHDKEVSAPIPQTAMRTRSTAAAARRRRPPHEANRTRHDQRAHQLRKFTHRGSEAGGRCPLLLMMPLSPFAHLRLECTSHRS